MLASHNSFSYGRPRKWWMRPLRPFAQCQGLDVDGQLTLGVRLFDARIVIHDDGEACFGHGLLEYDTDIGMAFSTLDGWGSVDGETVIVRLLLERGSALQFLLFVQAVTERYRHIRFIGGQRKRDWKQIADLPGFPVALVERYASMPSEGRGWLHKLNDLFPRLYARRHNADSYAEMRGTQNAGKCLMLDFVEVGRKEAKMYWIKTE